MPKQVKSYRISELTARQLESLMSMWGTSQTETLTVVIDRIYQQEIRHMNSGLTDNAWVKRVEEIRQMVADVPTKPESVFDAAYYVDEVFELQYDDEKAFAYNEFARQYGLVLADKP